MDTYNSAYDALFGTILLIISLFGTTFNIFSFIYFKTQSSTGNILFFRRLYSTITLTDTLMCVSMVPVIESAFSSGREGAMFTNENFCLFWTVVWTLLPQLSVFMVAVLSLSRLALLVRPSLRINPSIAMLLPVLCVAWSVGSSVGLIFVVGATQRYYKNWLGCTYNTFRPEDMTRKLTESDLADGLILRVILNIVPAASPIPITISFLLSMWFLHQAIKSTKKLSGSLEKQVEATKTVILFTLLYIILNIPYISSLVFFLSIWTTPELGNITVGEYEESHKLPKTLFLETYLIAIVSIASITVNSFINPLLYFWRMKKFRKYMQERTRSLSTSRINGHSQESKIMSSHRNARI